MEYAKMVCISRFGVQAISGYMPNDIPKKRKLGVILVVVGLACGL